MRSMLSPTANVSKGSLCGAMHSDPLLPVMSCGYNVCYERKQMQTGLDTLAELVAFEFESRARASVSDTGRMDGLNLFRACSIPHARRDGRVLASSIGLCVTAYRRRSTRL